MANKSYNVKSKRQSLFLAETTENEPLRLENLMLFLSSAKRSTKCPHCEHRGGWEISLNEVEGENPDNPRLSILVYPMLDGEQHTAAAMTCPNCGHLATISTFKIREFMLKEGLKNG